MTDILLALNLLVTACVLGFLVWTFRGKFTLLAIPSRLKGATVKSSLRPIRHKPIRTASRPLVTRLGDRTMSYWNDRLKPETSPIMATHYPETDEYEAEFGVEYEGRMPGSLFRTRYEEANVAQPVGMETLARSQSQGRTLAKARNRTILIAGDEALKNLDSD